MSSIISCFDNILLDTFKQAQREGHFPPLAVIYFKAKTIPRKGGFSLPGVGANATGIKVVGFSVNISGCAIEHIAITVAVIPIIAILNPIVLCH